MYPQVREQDWLDAQIFLGISKQDWGVGSELVAFVFPPAGQDEPDPFLELARLGVYSDDEGTTTHEPYD